MPSMYVNVPKLPQGDQRTPWWPKLYERPPRC